MNHRQAADSLGLYFQSRRTKGHAGLPTLSVTLNDGLVERESLDRKMETKLLPNEHLLVREGDIAYNMMRMWQGALGMAHYDALVSPAYIVLKPTDKIDSLFAEYLFKTPRYVHWFWAYSYGLTNDRLRLYFKDFAAIPCDLPSLPEQRRIAKILSTWDRAIEATEKLIANSEAQKKALMQQLLTGKKRLLGFHGEWIKTTLGDLGTVSSAGVDKKVVEGEQPVRLLNFLDAYHREFVFNGDLEHEVTAPSSKVSQCNVRKGDVFFTPSSETRDDIGLCAVAAEDMPGVVYSYHVVRLRPKQKLDLNFSAYIFQTDNFKRQTYRMGDGSGQRYVISQSNFRKMEIDIPPLPEQQAIGGILAESSRQIGKQRNDLERLKREKSALMQQLLTGKRRVAVNKEEAA
jgi:type I restriction enzyme S subunit